jgi:hypothetical protein
MFEIEILKTAQGAALRKGRSGAFAATRPQDRLACGFGGLGVWWPLLLRLPFGERKKIPMASVAFDIAICRKLNAY